MPTPDAAGREVERLIDVIATDWTDLADGGKARAELLDNLSTVADAARREALERAAAVCERERVRLMEVASQASSPSITEEVRLAQAQTAADLWHAIRKLLPADGEPCQTDGERDHTPGHKS